MTQLGQGSPGKQGGKKINKDLNEGQSKTSVGSKGQKATSTQRSGFKKDLAKKSGSLHQGQSNDDDDNMEDDDAKYMDMDLDDSYEDADFQIYFDRASLLNYITLLEDNNLFDIHVVQEDEQNLEKQRRQHAREINNMEK